MLIGGFIDEAGETRDFVVRSVSAGANEYADLRLGKVLSQALEDGHGWVVGVDAKHDLVVWIVLAAKAGEVLVGLRIETAHGLQIADGWDKSIGSGLCRAEEPANTEERDAVVNKRDRGYCKDCYAHWDREEQGGTFNQLTT